MHEMRDILQLIMILKFIHTNLGRVNYSAVIRRSAYLFSNDNDGNKGFDKFKRKVSPKDKTQKVQKQENVQKPTQKEEQKIAKTDSQLNKQATGFSNFARKPKVTKESQKISKMQQKKQSDQKQEPKPIQNKFKRYQRSSQPTKNNKEKQSQNVSGFSNFKRKSKISTQSDPLKQPKKEPHLQQKQIPKQMHFQEQKPNNNLGGFEKFKLKKKKVSPDNVPHNTNQKKQTPSQPSFNQDKPAEKQAEQPVEDSQKTSEQQKQAEAVNFIKDKKHKSPEQIEKEEAELELKKKQQFFKMRVKQFKQMKSLQQEKNKYFEYITQLKQKLQKNIQQRIGINLNFQYPLWIRNNPILMMLFNWKFFLAVAATLLYFALTKQYGQLTEISSEEFIKYIESGRTFKITFLEDSEDKENGIKTTRKAIITLKTGENYITESNNDFQSLVRNKVNILNAINPNDIILIINNYGKSEAFLSSARGFLSMALLGIFVYSLYKGSKGAGKSGQMSKNMFGQSQSKRFQQKVNVKFSDVVGMQKSKEEIVQFIDFLVNPQKYHKLGAKIPRGALLTGPPGTGKTMIAKACAGESNVPFFTISGSQFIEMYVGVGAQRVRDLFKEAKQAAPSIIFIDQIDAVGKKRSSGVGGGNDERDNTLNQLLVEMDGFQSNSNVIVFAATNQKDVLDPALTRPGRFDRLIEVDLPDIEGRKQIFMVHLKPIVIDQESTMEDYARRMATLTPGFSGADIKNLCNEAAIMAARNGNKFVTIHDFELATERVIAGVQKKSHLITEQTRRVVAYHECGHGVVSWFLQGANPLLKLTIIPRSKGSLGFAQYLPHETQISNRRQLEDQICVILGGRVAEEHFFGRISTGAYDDLQKAYNIAKMIVTQYGMDEKLGWLTYQESQYAKYYSKETQKLIDEQILKIIKSCTERCRALITEKRDLIDKLAQKLLEVQTIDLTKISEILGERPFKPNKQYQQYLKERKKMVEQIGKDNNSGGESGQSGKQDPVAAIKQWKKMDYLV